MMMPDEIIGGMVATIMADRAIRCENDTNDRIYDKRA